MASQLGTHMPSEWGSAHWRVSLWRVGFCPYDSSAVLGRTLSQGSRQWGLVIVSVGGTSIFSVLQKPVQPHSTGDAVCTLHTQPNLTIIPTHSLV